MKKILSSALFITIIIMCRASSYAEVSQCSLPPAPVPIEVLKDKFTNRDKRNEYSVTTEVVFDGTDCKIDGEGAAWDGEQLIINLEGCYRLTGRLDDGQIYVSADPSAKVQLVLDGSEIVNSKSAAVVIGSADKVFFTAAGSSENIIYSSADMKDEKIDAAIYSECDITFNGTGKLNVTCEDGHGILTKDDLKICSGDISVVSHKQGLSGKDSVRICGGDITIASERDGIHSEHTKSNKGYVLISGGNIEISSGKDGIYASNAITITDGTVNISSGFEGKSKDSSCACLRSDTEITMYGGQVEVSSADIDVRCPHEPLILGGSFVYN